MSNIGRRVYTDGRRPFDARIEAEGFDWIVLREIAKYGDAKVRLIEFGPHDNKQFEIDNMSIPSDPWEDDDD